MLDFHLGTGGIENPGEHVGGLSAEAIYWLQQNEFIARGSTAHLPEDAPESFPVGDDVVLSHEQVVNMYKKFCQKLKTVNKTPGFKSTDVEMLRKILEKAIENKSGLSTIVD